MRNGSATTPRLEVVAAFLKIGALGYGAAAIWGLIQAEVQERRAWLSKERFLEGMALVNALPGAPAMQMCIFLGHQRAGILGGLLAGLAFMAPAFAVMLALSALASTFGGVPMMRDAFYGLSPVILGVFIVAIYRLGSNAIKDLPSIAIGLSAAALAASSMIGMAEIVVLAGCAGITLYHSPKGELVATLIIGLLIVAEQVVPAGMTVFSSAGSAGQPGLWDLGLFFLKVGAVTFGGGMTIIAFVQDQLVNQLHWITAQEFLECLTLSQFTPGPIIMVAAYVGYKIAGLAGATVAAIAIFLPSFVLMLSILPFLERVRRLNWVKAAMKGISPAVVGAIAVSVVQLVPHAVSDILTGAMLIVTVLLLAAWRLPVLSMVVGGGVIGAVARSFAR